MDTIRRVIPVFALALAGCGGAGGDSTRPPPGDGLPYACDDNPGGFTDCKPKMAIDTGPVQWKLKVGPMVDAAIGDCDGDGLPDAYVFNWQAGGRLWRNRGTFNFTEITAEAGVAVDQPNGAAFADLDNDGDPDLVVALGIASLWEYNQTGKRPLFESLRVFQNDGKCHFADVSAAWGFRPRDVNDTWIVSGVDFADVNLDGRLDLLLRRLSFDASPALSLYLSRPDGTWAEQGSDVLKAVHGNCWANLFTDVDDDGLDDLFILSDARLGTPTPATYLHRKPPAAAMQFEPVVLDPNLFGPGSPVASAMGAASGDADGDGFLDTYITDIGPQHLYSHAGGFKDVAAAAGVAAAKLPNGAPSVVFAVSMADYDNDTWPDIALASSITDGFFDPPVGFLFHNRGAGSFEDTTKLLRQGPRQAQQFLTATDLDRDGHMDYWFGGEGEAPRILRNQVAGGKSIAVCLRGHTSNAAGIGAKVTVRVGARKLVQEMQTGGAPWGQGEPRLVFGLGDAAQADSVEVRFPSGFVLQSGAVKAGTEAVLEEPDLIRVEPAQAGVGQSITLTIKPAKPDGSPLGAGHNVTVTMDPSGSMLPVTDAGGGAYTATAKPDAAGLYGFTVRVDGTALLAHPQVLIR